MAEAVVQKVVVAEAKGSPLTPSVLVTNAAAAVKILSPSPVANSPDAVSMGSPESCTPSPETIHLERGDSPPILVGLKISPAGLVKPGAPLAARATLSLESIKEALVGLDLSQQPLAKVTESISLNYLGHGGTATIYQIMDTRSEDPIPTGWVLKVFNDIVSDELSHGEGEMAESLSRLEIGPQAFSFEGNYYMMREVDLADKSNPAVTKNGIPLDPGEIIALHLKMWREGLFNVDYNPDSVGLETDERGGMNLRVTDPGGLSHKELVNLSWNILAPLEMNSRFSKKATDRPHFQKSQHAYSLALSLYHYVIPDFFVQNPKYPAAGIAHRLLRGEDITPRSMMGRDAQGIEAQGIQTMMGGIAAGWPGHQISKQDASRLTQIGEHPIGPFNDQQIVLLDEITNLLKTIMTTDPSTIDFKTKVEEPLDQISALFAALRQESHSESFA